MRKVGLAGAGAVAHGYAAKLLRAGHRVAMWSPSGRGTARLVDRPLTATGVRSGDFWPTVCQSPAELCRESDTIVLALPANGHLSVMDVLVPHMAPRHAVVVSSHLEFSMRAARSMTPGRIMGLAGLLACLCLPARAADFLEADDELGGDSR